MKRCQKCNINVGGNHEYCPLCQNRLFGEAAESYFVPVNGLRKRLLAYKLQLFISIAIACVAIILDLLVGLNKGLHWSYVVLLWIIAGQLVVKLLMKKYWGITYFFSYISLALIILITVSGYYLGIGEFCLGYIVPGLIMAVLASEFAFCLGDKNNVVMPYLLGGIVLGLAVALVARSVKGVNPLLWNITLLVSLLLLVGLVIFKGRQVLLELKKRFHI